MIPLCARAAVCAWMLFAAALGAVQDPSVHLTGLDSESFISGPVSLRVALHGIRSDVESIRFFANGLLVCTVVRPPYECAWDAGPQVRSHQIRVVAELADRTRLVHTVRTKGLGYTEAVSVEVVHVPVLVTDGRGRYIRGLQPEGFRLFEDGVPQEITYFASREQPLEIALAIDISGSMEPLLQEVRKAVAHFLKLVRPEDAVTLIGFNDKAFTLARREASVEERKNAVAQLSAWGGTALHDAILVGLDLLGRYTGRKGLVVFTDGFDRSSRSTPEEVERALRQSDVVVHTVGLGSAASAAPRRLLQRMAHESGGQALFVRRAADLDSAFTLIVEELSHYYVLGYTPSARGRQEGWRRIRVELPRLRYTVRAREGYVAQVRDPGR